MVQPDISYIVPQINQKVDTQLTDITNGAVSYVDAALTAGTTYYYKVQPYRVVNSKKVFGDASGILSGKPLPSATRLNAESAGYKEVKTRHGVPWMV